MSSDFGVWQFRQDFSVHEAALLMLGINSSDAEDAFQFHYDSWAVNRDFERRSDLVTVYDGLKMNIRSGKLPALVAVRAHVNLLQESEAVQMAAGFAGLVNLP